MWLVGPSDSDVASQAKNVGAGPAHAPRKVEAAWSIGAWAGKLRAERKAARDRMPASIRTNRLLLRPATGADRLDLHRLEQDPRVMRHLNGGVATPLEPAGATGFLMPRGPEPGVWVVLAPPDERFAGWVSLRRDGRTAELGYRLRAEVWGRGYAVEAAAALMARGFADRRLEKVVAQTMAVNAPSRRVLERLGMTHVRTFFEPYPDPLPGSEEGEVEYAITRAEWKAAQAPPPTA